MRYCQCKLLSVTVGNRAVLWTLIGVAACYVSATCMQCTVAFQTMAMFQRLDCVSFVGSQVPQKIQMHDTVILCLRSAYIFTSIQLVILLLCLQAKTTADLQCTSLGTT